MNTYPPPPNRRAYKKEVKCLLCQVVVGIVEKMKLGREIEVCHEGGLLFYYYYFWPHRTACDICFPEQGFNLYLQQ